MSVVKLGLDAKWYFSGPPSGIVVVRNLIDILLQRKTRFRVSLFIREDEKEKFEKLISKGYFKSPVELIPVKGSNNFLQNMTILPALVNRHEIDIMIYQSFIPIFFRKKTKNIAFILDLLDLDYPQYFKTIEKLVYKFRTAFLPKVDHIITISHSEKDRIHRHTNISPEKISVVHLGVNENFRQHTPEECSLVKKKYNLPDNFILYIGRLNVRKNIPTLIEAMENTDQNWPLVLIGKKEGRSYDIEKKIDDLKIADKVIFLGYIPEEDLAAILSSASIFCFPSFAEGFGLPPLEALKSGTPVITTQSTSIPEVCGDAVIYFDPHSAKDLTDKINYLAKNEQIRNEMIERGLRRATNFTWDNSTSELITILESVVNIKKT